MHSYVWQDIMYEFTFYVEALTADGELCISDRLACSKAALIVQLHKEGLLLVHCRKKYCISAVLRRLAWQKRQVRLRLQFINGLCNTLRSGIPLADAIQIISKTSDEFLRAVCVEVTRSIYAGNSLQEALEKTGLFEKTHLAILKAGELSGTLEESLMRLRDMYQDKQIYHNKLTEALLYPFFTIFVTMLCIYTISTYILPQIITITSQTSDTNNFELIVLSVVGHYVPLLFFFLVAFIFINSIFFRNKFNWFKRIAARMLLRVPILGNFIMLCEAAIFARLLCMLLQSGMRIDQSFNIASEACAFESIRDSFHCIAENLGHGISMESSFVLAKDDLPGMLLEALLTVSKTGAIPETLDFAVKCMENEIAVQKIVLTNLLQPVLIMTIGLFIAYFAFTVLSHVYGMIGSL